MKPDFEERVAAFVAACAERAGKYHEKHYPNLKSPLFSMDVGSKYVRIVRRDGNAMMGGQRSVHCFLDKETGDIFKAASWKAPAKHSRGNIYADDLGMSGMTEYGAKYL